MKETTNYVPWNRNWTAVKRHLPLIIKPGIAAMIVVLIWRYVIYRHSLFFGKESEEALLFIIITFTSFVYVIFAGYAVGAVFSDYKEISKAVVRNDVDTFLQYRDEQLPILMHLLVGTASVFMVVFTALFPFGTAFIGGASVFVVTYMVALVYVIVQELDDYRNSIWFNEKIPKDWYEKDIAEHFKEKQNKA